MAVLIEIQTVQGVGLQNFAFLCKIQKIGRFIQAIQRWESSRQQPISRESRLETPGKQREEVGVTGFGAAPDFVRKRGPYQLGTR